MFKAAQAPGGAAALARSMQIGAIRRGPLAYGGLTAEPIDETLLRSFVDPLYDDLGVRRDGMRFAGGADTRDTMDAAAKLPDLRIPVLLAWGADDRFFTLEDARRLAELIPDARLVEIAGAKTFVMLDGPSGSRPRSRASSSSGRCQRRPLSPLRPRRPRSARRASARR